jgi:hypothetical protein
MPLIYPPSLTDIYRNTFSVTSSILRTAPPADFVLESDGNGATFWTSVLGSNAGTSSLTVTGTLTANRGFIDYLSTGFINFSTNIYPIVTVSSLTLSTFIANTGFQTFISTPLTIANALEATILNSQLFQTDIISTNYFKGDYYSTPGLNLISLSTIQTDALNIIVDQSTIAESAQISTLITDTTSFQNLTVFNSAKVSTINANSVYSDRFTTVQTTALNLNVSTINGLVYPPQVAFSANLEASTLFARDSISTVLTNANSLSTITLLGRALYTDQYRANLISTNAVNTGILNVQEIIASTLQAQSTLAFTANFQTLVGKSLSTNQIKTVTTSGSHATMQSLTTTNAFANIAQFTSGIATVVSTANLNIGEYSTTDPVYELQLSSISLNAGSLTASSIQTRYLSSGFLQASETVGNQFSGQQLSTGTLFTDSVNVSSVQLESLSTTTLTGIQFTALSENSDFISSGILYANTVLANAWITEFLSSQTGTITNPTDFQSTFVGNLYTSSIAVPTAKIDAISSIYVSTSTIEASYTQTSSLQTNAVVSLESRFTDLLASNATAETVSSLTGFADLADFTSVSTNTLFASTIIADSGNSVYGKATEIYTNILETTDILYPIFNGLSLSSITANAQQLQTSSLIANEISTTILEGQTVITTNATVNQELYTSSFIGSFFQTTTFRANTASIEDLQISSLVGAAYPPPLPFPDSLEISSATVAETTTASTINVDYLSTSQLYIDTLNSQSTYITSLSSVQLFSEVALTSTLITDTISANTFYVGDANIEELYAATFSTMQLHGQVAQISSINANTVSSLIINTDSLYTSSLITDQISTTVLEGQTHTGLILNANTVSSAILNITDLSVEKFSAKILSTIFLSTQDAYISSLVTDSIIAQSTLTTSSILNELTTNYISSGVGHIGLVSLDSANLNSLSTAVLTTSSISFSTIQTDYLSTSRITAETASAVEAIVQNVSTYNTIADNMYASSINTHEISSTTLSIDNAYTSSLNLDTISVGKLLTSETRISSIYVDQLSTGITFGQGFISSLYTDLLSVSSFTANIINASSLQVGQLSTTTLQTPVANISSLHTNYVQKPFTENHTIRINSTIQTDFYDTSNLNANRISTFSLNTYFISTHTMVVYGGNTLNVSGSSIFTGLVEADAEFKADSITASTLSYVTILPEGAIFEEFNSGVILASTITTEEVSVKNLLAYSIETPQFETLYASLSSLITPYISTTNFYGSNTTVSSLTAQQATYLGRVDQVPYISSQQAVSIVANIQSIQTSLLYTSSLYANNTLASTVNTHFLSTASIVVPSNGFANTLTATNISTTTVTLNRLTIPTVSTFTLSSIEVRAPLTDTFVNSIDTSILSTQSIRVFSANGFAISSLITSTNTAVFNLGRFTTISTNELSTTSLLLNNGIFQTRLDMNYISTGSLTGSINSITTLQTLTNNISTTSVSSQSIFINSLTMSTLSTTRLYASQLESVSVIANFISTNFYTSVRNTISNVNVNFVSVGSINAPGSRFTFSNIATSSLIANFATVSNLTLQDSIFSRSLTTNDTHVGSLSFTNMTVSTISSGTVFGISTGTSTYLSTNFLSVGSLQGVVNSEFFLDGVSSFGVSTNRTFVTGLGVANGPLEVGEISTTRFFAGDTFVGAVSTNNLEVGSLTINSVTANVLNTNSVSSGTITNIQPNIYFDLISTNVISSGLISLSGTPGLNFQGYTTSFAQNTYSNIDNSYYFDLFTGLYGDRRIANFNGYASNFVNVNNATNFIFGSRTDTSVLWNGFFYAKATGNYRFISSQPDDFLRFWIGPSLTPKSSYYLGSPKQISGLYTWFDATDSNTLLNSSGNTMTPSDTSRISQWLDKSGNNRHASSITGSALTTVYPTWCNDTSLGKPIVYFNQGSSNQMNVAGFTYPFDVYIVNKPANLTATQKELLGAGQSNADNFRAVDIRTPQLWEQSSSGATNSFTSPLTETTLNYRIVRWTQSSSYNAIWQNAIPLSTNTTNWASAPTELTGRFRIGARTTVDTPLQTTQTWNGNIGEILIYNKVLSDPERYSVENYLSQKWGITIAGTYASTNQLFGGGAYTLGTTYSNQISLEANKYYPMRIQYANGTGNAIFNFGVIEPGNTTCNYNVPVNSSPAFQSTITNFINLNTQFSTIQTVQYGNFQQLSTLFLSTATAINIDNYFVNGLSTSAISSIVTNVRIFNSSNLNTIGSISTGLLQTSNVQANVIITDHISSQVLSSSSLFVSSLQNLTYVRGTRLAANEVFVTEEISTLSTFATNINTNLLNISSFSNASQGLLQAGDTVYRRFINYNAQNVSGQNTSFTNQITTSNFFTGGINTKQYSGVQIKNLSSTTNSLPDFQLGDWGVYFRQAPNNDFPNRLESLNDGYLFNSTLFVHLTSNAVGINTTNVSTHALNINGSLIVRASAGAYKPTLGDWSSGSDKRVKTDIVPADLDRCYDINKTLSLFDYNFIDEYCKKYNVTNTIKTGFIAQHVSSFFPNATRTKEILWFKDALTLNTYQAQLANYGSLQKLISSFDTVNETISTFIFYPNAIQNFEQLRSLNKSLELSYINFQTSIVEKQSTLEGTTLNFQTLESSFTSLVSHASTLLQEVRDKKAQQSLPQEQPQEQPIE